MNHLLSKILLLTIVTLTILFACNEDKNANKNGLQSDAVVKPPKNGLVQLKKLTVIGNFDEDGLLDTILQNNISAITKLPIDSFPNNEWDSTVDYFYKLDADVILTLSNKKTDTLHLGLGSGLYCLINIGDNNNDKKDEIAFVVDYVDFSNINACSIYTLCGNKWIALKHFKINESAFDFETNTVPNFKQINGFLENRKHTWFYIDYDDLFNAESYKDTFLKPLKLKKGCERID